LLISPSNFVAKTLAKEIGVKIITLPNFVPAPPCNIGPANLSNYFLFVGMLEKHKGILHLLQVAKELSREMSFRLVILGDGSLKKNVIGFVKENKLTSSIIYLGFVAKEELYPLYKNAKALIIPSICAENAPLTALEALSVGTPVIASNVGGLPEIVNKCNQKLLFNNSDELMNILCAFSKDEPSCDNAQQAYSQYFSKDAYFNSYFDEIRNMRGRNSQEPVKIELSSLLTNVLY
jgi:glycosyltransferase involved in cell wall biosynthesis